MGELKKQYLYKLFAGFFSVGSLGAIQALALRALGPASYGMFDFLNTFYIQVITLADMGAADFFYTKLSKRPRDGGLLVFYALFILAGCAMIFLLTATAVASPLSGILWPDIPHRFIMMGAVLGALTWVANSLNKCVDAFGLTVAAETMRVLQKVLGMVLLAMLVWAGGLTLTEFFGFWHAMMLFLAVAFLGITVRGGYGSLSDSALTREQGRRHMSEFYRYSHPLFVYAAATFVSAFFGRWLLQRHSGSVEQALFGVSEQISSMCALSVRVMTPLLLRELSVAYQKNDSHGLERVIRGQIPVLFSVTVYFACFTAVHSEAVVRLLGGPQYAGATSAAMVMALTAIPQSAALMFGAVLLAASRTDLYRNVGIAMMVGGAALNYAFLSPASAGGLHWGALGLAVQSLIVHLIAAGVLQALAVRSAGMSLRAQLERQAAVFAMLLTAAVMSKGVSLLLVQQGASLFGAFFAAGAFYTSLTLLLLRVVPRVFGLERGIDIMKLP